MLAEQRIKDIIASFPDPLASSDLHNAGRVEAIVSTENQLIVTLAVPVAAVDKFQELRNALQAQLASQTAQQVQVVLTADKSSAGIAERKQPVRQNIDTSRIRNIIAVASGKGGVGKSTVAVNLAAALQARGFKTGLLDADIYGPSVPRMAGLAAKPETNDDKKIIPLETHGLKVMSIGFLVDAEQPMIWRGPMVQTALLQMIRDVAWDDLDYLIIDLPPGTGDIQLTLAQQVSVTGAVIVSTPQDIALIDARKAVGMFNKVGTPILGIVENMSVFVCENCGHETHIFSHGGAKAEAAKLGIPLLAEIPLEISIRQHADAGEPLAWYAPDSAAAKSYIELSKKIAKA